MRLQHARLLQQPAERQRGIDALCYALEGGKKRDEGYKEIPYEQPCCYKLVDKAAGRLAIRDGPSGTSCCFCCLSMNNAIAEMEPDMSDDAHIVLDIWSDYVCPFCYLELPAVTRLQQEFGPLLEVVWRAFELRPDPVPTLDPDGDYLHTVWNRSVYPMAEKLGMRLKLPPVQPRSRKAFEAVAFARDAGRFDTMHLALFRGFFEHGRNIGDSAELLRLAEENGIDSNALRAALQDGRYTGQVLQDERQAQALGISGVPLMLVRRAGAPMETAVGLQGAVPYEQLYAAVCDVAGRERTPRNRKS